jgi:hypothetical protein
MAATKRVNTATLIRGEVYTLRHPKNTPANPKEALRFKRDEPVIIEDTDVLNLLEDLHEETQDGDGEIFEKPTFHIERGVAGPAPTKRKTTRLASSRVQKTRPRRRK